MKVYVVMVYDPWFDSWQADQRCYTSREAAKKHEQAIKNDTGKSTKVLELDLVDDLQVYAEQRNGDNADNVNHPAHYTNGEIECIDAIKAALTPEEFRGYVKGLTIKYVWREQLKGHDEDLAKARWYLSELLESEVRDD